MTPALTRPALRFHGGKWRLAPWLIRHFPAHRVFVECFAGGAAVLLRKPRVCAEVLNDRCGEIVSFFRVLRDPEQAQELARVVALTPFARDEFSAADDGENLPPVERARRTLIRSFMGFGSDGVNTQGNSTFRARNAHGTRSTGFRGCCRRSFTTAAGDWAHYPAHIHRFTERLQGVVLENRDACEVILQQDGEDALFYADPPYPLSVRGMDRRYRHEMTDDDHRALAEVLRGARGMVALSGYACPLYDRELFPDWERVECRTLADGARERTEILWLNAAAARRQGQRPLDFSGT